MTIRRWAPPPLSGFEPMIVNVALTGAVPSKADTPHLPIAPKEIVTDALACAEAGASIVHVHARDDAGEPVHDRVLYSEIIGGIRDEMPELIVCATTSGRVDPDPAARMTALELDEPLRPDMASLTLGSFNFARTVSYNPPDLIQQLLMKMRDQNVKPEFEVFEAGMVNSLHVLIEKGLVDSPPYCNILLGSMGAAPAFIGDLARIVDRLPDGTVWGAAGVGVFQRLMVMAAAAMGGNVRTGLEDSPRWKTGEANNVAAVEHAVAAAQLAGRTVATPDEARLRLGLKPR